MQFSKGHADDFHRDEKYLRDYLVPRQEPSLGEYDDRDEAVIREHLRMSRQANCRVWISAWFGVNSREDTTLRNNIFPTLEAHDPDHRVAIHYESNGNLRYKDDAGNIFHTVNGKPNKDKSSVADHMEHFCKNVFTKPNYYFVQNNRPVIFLYVSRVLDNPGKLNKEGGGTWDSYEFLELVLNTMRDAALEHCPEGMVPFIVGDHVFNPIETVDNQRAFEILDAVTG